MQYQSHGLVAICAIYLFLLQACSAGSNESVDRRSATDTASSPTEETGELNPESASEAPSETNAIVDQEPIALTDPNLQPASGAEFLAENFFSNIQLVSKVASDTVILFGLDGRSWVYGAADATEPTELQPVVGVPEDGQLFTMDGDDFWMLTPSKVSKRKQQEGGDPNEVVLINFDITQLSGDPAQRKVLGVSHSSLILFGGSHIAVFEVNEGEPSAFEFKTELPPGTGSQLLAAGSLKGDGYWFATEQNLATLRRGDGEWVWTVAQTALMTDGILGFAAEPDLDNRSFQGDTVIWNAEGVQSASGAPIAAAP